MRKNKYNLPQQVLSVIEGLNPERPRPTKDVFHVTELLMPAYARNLLVEKWDEIEVDYSDYLISVQGDALHEAYQKYLSKHGYFCEVKFSEEISGITLVGTLDAYDIKAKTLVSLKQTSVWSPSYKIEDYAKQENCYKWFLKEPVEKIVVDIWYRNWQLKQAGWSHDYPKIPYEQMSIPVWPIEKTERFIKQSIEYLLTYKGMCSREERWMKYQVIKNKNKNSSKNCTTIPDAEAWIAKYHRENPQKKDKFTVVDAPPTNCISYCPARSVCPFALSLKGKK